MPPTHRLDHNGPPVPWHDCATALQDGGCTGPDRNTRWHLVDDVPPATSVVPLLDTVDDPRRAFHG